MLPTWVSLVARKQRGQDFNQIKRDTGNQTATTCLYQLHRLHASGEFDFFVFLSLERKFFGGFVIRGAGRQEVQCVCGFAYSTMPEISITTTDSLPTTHAS